MIRIKNCDYNFIGVDYIHTKTQYKLQCQLLEMLLLLEMEKLYYLPFRRRRQV